MQGAAAGPCGVAAGGRYASGTAVRGPKGNVYTHETTAGRGVAAGPNGVAAGRYAGSGRPSTAQRSPAAVYGAYGTHPWSPTAYHAQAMAGRDWCCGNHLYTRGWSTIHPWAWMPAGYLAADWAAAAWTPATWPALGSCLGYADAEPYSYNYGNTSSTRTASVYYGGQSAGTASSITKRP